MKEYLCIKDFQEFAKAGDKILLLPDNETVVNASANQRTTTMPQITTNRKYFGA